MDLKKVPINLSLVSTSLSRQKPLVNQVHGRFGVFWGDDI